MKSHLDLPAKARTAVIELANAQLADAIDLQLQAKQAHWNVKGAQFIALHKYFDELYGVIEEWVDDLAERVVALGGVAEGRAAAVAKTTRLPKYPDAVTGAEHLRALARAVGTFGASARAAIDQADEAGDAGSADLFTGISRACDKHLSFIEAHLQG
jgi:starvation-inducible DNA-binding protein